MKKLTQKEKDWQKAQQLVRKFEDGTIKGLTFCQCILEAIKFGRRTKL